MLDGLSLDQIRTFIAANDEGSFSAAARHLGRAQSVVSQTLANLEAQLGVSLFDRAARYPVLTDTGRALLADARAVAGGVDQFKAKAKCLAGGLEAELSIAVDIMFPIRELTCAIAAFQAEFPNTPLRLYVEALGAVIQPVLDRRCAFGIVGSLPITLPTLSRERLLSTKMVMVAARSHPLASCPRPIAADTLAQYVQLVISDRSDLSKGREFGVLSPKTWRLADLGAKHAFLRAGLGWGAMPLPLIKDDLDNGSLVQLHIDDIACDGLDMTMWATFRTDTLPGPAGRWLIDRLKQANDATASEQEGGIQTKTPSARADGACSRNLEEGRLARRPIP